ncbi:MAG: type II toxin-antitoxin system RelE/ParE family toxin [Planctomycetaceae bacterium]|nr:type II toxin-antitoxin system RelE/ParE family toxin [Planctomycetaceae bacterium]
MKYSIRLTEDAKQDIDSIALYIARNDDPRKAKNLVAKLKTEMKRLDTFPERGAYPEELLLLDIREVREVYYGPYRMFYRIVGRVVQILAVADGRRDLQTFLVNRIFREAEV